MIRQLPQRDPEPAPKDMGNKATLQPGDSTKIMPLTGDDSSKVVHLGAGTPGNQAFSTYQASR